MLTLRIRKYCVVHILGGSGPKPDLVITALQNKVFAFGQSSWLPGVCFSSFNSGQLPSHTRWFSNTELSIICWMLFLTSDFAHVVSLPGTPFIPFYFINPYSSLTIQLRCHFLLLPGWIRYPILLYISIRVISTLNQFVFLFKSKLHALRGCFVYHCLPTTLSGCLHYVATIQLPKNIQKVKQGCTYRR